MRPWQLHRPERRMAPGRMRPRAGSRIFLDLQPLELAEHGFELDSQFGRRPSVRVRVRVRGDQRIDAGLERAQALVGRALLGRGAARTEEEG